MPLYYNGNITSITGMIIKEGQIATVVKGNVGLGHYEHPVCKEIKI